MMSTPRQPPLYQEKFERVLPLLTPVLPVDRPEGAFYLWAEVPGDDAAFVRGCTQQTNLTVLPGSFMARAAHGENPGAGRVRISLVPELAQCLEAAQRLRRFLEADFATELRQTRASR